MSDYYRNHNQSSDPFQPPRNGAAEDAAPWDMPMDAPEMAQGMPVWQQPGVMGGGFLEEDPAPFGAEMQQSGVPLFQDAMDFRTQGDDAPTRVAKPLAQQLVNKRTTVGRGPSPFERPVAPAPQPAETAPAPQPAQPASGPEREETPAPRRRRSRVAERAQEAPVAPAQQEYDLFEAGDSEAPETPSAPRRAAVPGGRYTGARTAMPEGGPRSRSAARASEAERPLEDEAAPAPRRAAQPGPRPAQPGRRPAQRPPQQRPAAPQQGQRPVQQAAMPPVGQRMAQAEMEGNAMPRRQAGPRQQPARPAANTQPPRRASHVVRSVEIPDFSEDFFKKYDDPAYVERRLKELEEKQNKG